MDFNFSIMGSGEPSWAAPPSQPLPSLQIQQPQQPQQGSGSGGAAGGASGSGGGGAAGGPGDAAEAHAEAEGDRRTASLERHQQDAGGEGRPSGVVILGGGKKLRERYFASIFAASGGGTVS